MAIISVRQKKHCRFHVTFKVYVFPRQTPGYTAVRLISANSAVSDIHIDGKPGMMYIKDGWYHINLKRSGYHDIKTTFSISKNQQSFHMPMSGAINTLDFSLPLKNYDIDVINALNVANPPTPVQAPVLPLTCTPIPC